MFPLPLVVKVADNNVILSIRTADERVDEFTMGIEDFESMVENAKIPEPKFGMISRHVHFSLQVSEGHRAVFSVSKSAWDVMLAEYRVRVGG